MQSDSPDVRMHYDSSEDDGAFFSADEGDAPLSRKDFTRLRSDVTTALKHFEEYKGEVAGVIKTCFQEQQQTLQTLHEQNMQNLRSQHQELLQEQEQELQTLREKAQREQALREELQQQQEALREQARQKEQEREQALRQQARQKELTREQEQESQDLLPKNAGRESFNESVQVSGS